MRGVVMLMVALCVLGLSAPAKAQTITPTPGPTSTPTITPEVFLGWTMPAPDIAGTPQPGQGVAFGYQMNAGDVMMALIKGAIFLTLLIVSVLWVIVFRREDQ